MSRYLFYVIGGYLSGSVLYARVMCRLFGAGDALLQSKDANPGTSNAFAYGGFACGVLTLVGDLMKGILPVWLYVRTGSGITPASLALVLAAPVVGHAFPCFFGFHGGKAIAVSFGCLLGLVPFWGPVLIFAGSFIFFSVVVRIPFSADGRYVPGDPGIVCPYPSAGGDHLRLYAHFRHGGHAAASEQGAAGAYAGAAAGIAGKEIV